MTVSVLHQEKLLLDSKTKNQIDQSLKLVQNIFEQELLGIYLYGSAMSGGLQKYSDIDLFVVLSRSTTREKKAKLVKGLLEISGIYMKSPERPIELTIVDQAEVNPWRYPPKFDFQYGEWLRDEFERGNVEPWSSKEMPDLAILITQVLLASVTLVGENPEQLLSKVPYRDFISATKDLLPNLISEINSDTRNVLLTLARIWCTVATDVIRSKPAAADWAVGHLPEKYQLVLKRAKQICIGEEKELWNDLQELIKPCANFMMSESNKIFQEIMVSNDSNRSVHIA